MADLSKRRIQRSILPRPDESTDQLLVRTSMERLRESRDYSTPQLLQNTTNRVDQSLALITRSDRLIHELWTGEDSLFVSPPRTD